MDTYRHRYLGPTAIQTWREDRKAARASSGLDVVLMSHPRDEHDLPRLFPWSGLLNLEDRRTLTTCLKPLVVEVIQTPKLNVGLLFLPFYARELIDPRTRRACREFVEQDGLAAAAAVGARLLCLGGLTGALTLYGRKLLEPAEKLGIGLTTGHSVTAISVLRTYLRAVDDLQLQPRRGRMAILGLGSIGTAFAQLLVRQARQPRSLVLVERPSRADSVAELRDRLRAETNLDISIELTGSDGQLVPNSACYDSTYVISAVSTPYVIDVNRLAPRTVLVDDSQPYCWDRDAAWERCRTANDLVPCEAGLVDCASIGYRSHFPFDFADHDQSGSRISWSCLAEGLLRALEPDLPSTIGAPTVETLREYDRAFEAHGFGVPALQCGPHELPIERLREAFFRRPARVAA